jgi:hypothetical protein
MHHPGVSTVPTSADSRRDQPVERQLLHSRVGVDHEQVLVEARVNANDVLDLVVHLELEGVHRRVEVDL